ncbi:MAG: hypothetical protein V1685_07170 [Parcubacteria group bacterium]
MTENKSFLKKFWWLMIILVVVAGVGVWMTLTQSDTPAETNKSSDNTNNSSQQGASQLSMDPKYPACPTDLVGSGLLTSPILPLDKTTSIIPLGNFTIPGHILPVDHNYFANFADPNDRVPVYAPGNLWLYQIMEDTVTDATGAITERGYDFHYVVCRGIVLIISSPDTLKGNVAQLIQDNQSANCKTSPGKHAEGEVERQCFYSVDYQTTAGELVGETGKYKDYTHSGEVFAFNYNMTPDPAVNWNLWSDSDYGHAFCLFDLYGGSLKSQHEAKMGIYEVTGNDKVWRFRPRTIKPFCGQINQDIPGTAQGNWFGADKSDSATAIENSTLDITLSYDNIDPAVGRIVIGGNISESGVIYFTPENAGTVNRKLSDVTADNNIYCYDNRLHHSGTELLGGKVLLQLVDPNHLKIEYMADSACRGNEVFQNPFTYFR